MKISLKLLGILLEEIKNICALSCRNCGVSISNESIFSLSLSIAFSTALKKTGDLKTLEMCEPIWSPVQCFSLQRL